MVAEITRRARLWAECEEADPTPDVVDWAAAEIRNGSTIAELAREMTTRTGVSITREMLSGYLHSQPANASGEAAKLRLSRVRPEFAEAQAETGLIELKEATREELPMVAAAARHRQWLAETADRERYGRSGAVVNIGISADSIHLDALRAFAPATVAHLPGSMGAIDNGAERAMIRNVNPSP
jgi:hypothetical protein